MAEKEAVFIPNDQPKLVKNKEEKKRRRVSSKDVVKAVINEYPEETFKLGEKSYEIRDLPYDSYIEFIELMAPLFETLFSAASSPNTSFDVRGFVKLAGIGLPRMVLLMIRDQDPEVTVDDIKKYAKTPYVLVEIILKQVEHNKMIEDFASFFAQLGLDLKQVVPTI